MRQITRLAILLALLIPAATALGVSKQTLTGSWNCVAHGGSHSGLTFTLDLQQNGQTVTGDVTSSIGDADIASATFINNFLKAEIDTPDTQYTLKAHYHNGKLSGTWSSSASGEKGTWEGTKSASH